MKAMKQGLPESWKQHWLYSAAQLIRYLIYFCRQRIRFFLRTKLLLRCAYPFFFRRYSYPRDWAKFRASNLAIRRSIAARKPGISGFCRIYNEENILKSSIQSQLSYYDEMVLICEGNCTDRSWEICKELKQQYPDRIKIYQYEPPVYPILSREIYLLPRTHPNSLVNYYNYSLLKTSREIIGKVDADMIIIDPLMKPLVSEVRATVKERRVAFLTALDLWYNEDRDEVMIDPEAWFSGNPDLYFVHLRKYFTYHFLVDGVEAINFIPTHPLAPQPPIHAGFTQFHLKKWFTPERYIFMVQSRPENTLSEAQLRDQWQQRKEERMKRLMSWEQFIEQFKGPVSTFAPVDKLPDPNIYIREKAPEWIAAKGRQG